MNPLFVGGYARTGTTMMQGIICSDRKAFPVTRESTYLSRLLAVYKDEKDIWSYHTHDYFDSKKHFREYHRRIIVDYMDHIRSRWGAGMIVQKQPVMTAYFPEILELIPASRFLVMVRDPRDAIASQVVRHADTPRGKEREVLRYLDDYFKRYFRVIQYREKFGDRLLFVPYELLVNVTDKVLPAIRKHTSLSISWDCKTSTWESRRPPDDESASSLDGKTISNTSVGNYKSVLTDEEISEIEKSRDRLNNLLGFDLFLADNYTD